MMLRPVDTDQCVAAVPSVFNVDTPTDLPEAYQALVQILEFGINFDIVIPAACFGGYQRSRKAASIVIPDLSSLECHPVLS